MTNAPDPMPVASQGIGTVGIACIGVGAVVVLVGIIVAVILIKRKKKAQRQKKKKGPKKSEEQIPLGNYDFLLTFC